MSRFYVLVKRDYFWFCVSLYSILESFKGTAKDITSKHSQGFANIVHKRVLQRTCPETLSVFPWNDDCLTRSKSWTNSAYPIFSSWLAANTWDRLLSCKILRTKSKVTDMTTAKQGALWEMRKRPLMIWNVHKARNHTLTRWKINQVWGWV